MMPNANETKKTAAAALLRLLAVSVISLHLSASASTTASPPSFEARFEAAIEAYRAGHYPTAYGQMIKLAGEGHGEAARIALLMHRYGARLYGSQWDATPDQIQRWVALATRAMQEQARLSAE
ncbi:MAG: hypothetical protein ACOVQL_00810 [Limnohabitans sp.]